MVDAVNAPTDISPLALLDLDVAALNDGELIEAMVAARRLASRVQAVELAAVGELARRRFAEADAVEAGERVEVLSPREYLYDEVAGALTLTAHAADDLVDLATGLTDRLPGTYGALRDGRIDYPKARVIQHATQALDPEHTATIESLILGRAPHQTTGQIRAKINRLIRRLDPGALERRRRAAEAVRDVHLCATPDGTTHLSGIDLPERDAHAAYGRVNAIAAALKGDGDARTIGQLRADVYLGLLRGTLTTTEPPARHIPAAAPNTGAPGWTAADDQVADTIADAVRAELAGLGLPTPANADQARLLTKAGRRIRASLADLKTRHCVPDHNEVGYRPPARMRRLIETRDKRCCYPGCRRPSYRCDADHTTPYLRGGVTCPCNISMLCRHHHRLRQTPGWHIEHSAPRGALPVSPAQRARTGGGVRGSDGLPGAVK